MLRQLRVVWKGVTAVGTEKRRQRARPLLLGVRRHVTIDAQLRHGAVLAVAALVPFDFHLSIKHHMPINKKNL
jgi:hypothetical protein